MIANRGLGRWKGAASFAACVDYVTRSGEAERPLSVWSSGVSSIATAAFEMRAVASQSRVIDPVYHLIVSWGPDERPSLERVREAVDEQLDRLGLDGLQMVAAIHDDGIGGMLHAHVVLNRVDPLTLVGRSTWRDQVRMREACREVERNDGWRVVGEENADSRGEVAREEEREGGDEGERPGVGSSAGKDAGPSGESRAGSNASDPYGMRAKFGIWVREQIRPALDDLLQRTDATWQKLGELLSADQLRYEVVSAFGARIVGTVSGWAVSLSEIGMKHRDFVDRLGEWIGVPSSSRERGEEELRAKVAQVRDVVEGLDDGIGWAGVHEALRALGVGFEMRNNGARIVDLNGPSWQRIDRDDPILSRRAMRDRFGPYASSDDEQHREKLREVLRRAENLLAGEQLSRDPSPIFTTLFHTRSAVTLDELRKDVNRRVIDTDQRENVFKAALDGMIAVEIAGDLMLTAPLVQSEERAAARSAGELASGRLRTNVASSSSGRLDKQQSAAFTYATAREGRLKVVTGVPGAGKTTLLNEVAAGYTAAGYRVRGVAVANSAVEVLRRETSIPARSVAKELYEWRRGGGSSREQLTARDVLIIDEVSTLGTEQGGALLAAAARAGAVVIAVGDDKQFQSVARGDALRIMQQAVGERTVDLTRTRRHRHEWQREATHAVRRGDVRGAMEAYRDRGFVRESRTQSEARDALVKRWTELERDGVEVGVETYTNKERLELNALARAAFRQMGRLSSPDAYLETMDGKTPYAIGERITVRETIRGADLFNGSAVTVRDIRGAVLDVERRDGSIVSIDTREHPGVQHGYASTEYREQGSTRYAELQLLTRQVNRRSLTVGMTRHTDEFTAFYSREEFRKGFSGVVQLGLRSEKKALVLDGVERGRARDVFAPRLERELDRDRGVEITR